MQEESTEKPVALRSGFTTGACATATAVAAAMHLLGSDSPGQVTITLPLGKRVDFEISGLETTPEGRARASTVKDAGDDPDVTHGATVFCELSLKEEPGVNFHAAPGVGTVTREGLELAVGEPAINPVPRQMIASHLEAIAGDRGYAGGFDVHVGIENGEEIALKTMNGRLGIVGGLSILGTTGIVRPYSCAAFIASIHQSMDVAHANGIREMAASTGSTSERYIQAELGLPDMALIEMWDFAGAVLKYLRKVPLEKLTICGGFGKMTKLAAGHQSLHSKDAPMDFEFLGQLARELGAQPDTVEKILEANTSMEALAACQDNNVPLAREIAERAKTQALKVSRNACDIDVYCIDRKGQLLATTAAP